MIIRSGVIKSQDSVDFGEFSKHWKEVHGPLARIVPRMRAYSQNHIRKTLASGEPFGFHGLMAFLSCASTAPPTWQPLWIRPSNTPASLISRAS